MQFGRSRATGSLGLVALVLCASVSNATTYFVATTGNDSSSGSTSSPWRTLQKAANTAKAGDVVLVASGTYVGFQVTADGTSTAPIVFRANGSNVVINARNATTPDNINIEGGNYVTVEGFIVNDAPRVGIRAVSATGVVIRNNVISRSGLDGILSGYTPQIQIIDNVASGSLQEHGIYVSNSTTANDNPVVRGNECFDNHQNGMQFNGDCDAGGDGIISGAVIEGNVIHHNQWKGFSLISLQNSTIRNNLVYENGLSAGAGGIHLADQPGCSKPSSNNVVVNNTVHEPRIACIRMTNGSTANVVFNNLLVARSLAYTIADEVGGNYVDPASNLKLTSADQEGTPRPQGRRARPPGSQPASEPFRHRGSGRHVGRPRRPRSVGAVGRLFLPANHTGRRHDAPHDVGAVKVGYDAGWGVRFALRSAAGVVPAVEEFSLFAWPDSRPTSHPRSPCARRRLAPRASPAPRTGCGRCGNRTPTSP